MDFGQWFYHMPCAARFFLANSKWRLSTELPCIHVTMPLQYKNCYGVHRAGQIFDRTGYKFNLYFGVQIFERLGV